MKAKKQKKECSKSMPRDLEDKDLKTAKAGMSACLCEACDASVACAC